MSLAPGTRLGPYEIVAPLGAGGMGEVHRARDTRLGRDVAIKALPAEFAGDPERLARFEREARLLASISHPNIAGIYGLEEVDGARYLVLEFVDGETLAARLARGALPPDQAIDICRQIAAGVEAAHEGGVVHRDLKPGNVMLAASGAVKVLDFGLARSAAAGASGSGAGLSASPTVALATTGAGVILGTAAYMSPEQARGRAVDRRTDVWSFGCVLYECLTGRQAYDGETVSDLIARILEREPDWGALPLATPPRVAELLRRCLTKDATLRLRDIGEARVGLTEPGTVPAAGVSKTMAASRTPRRWMAPAAAALVAVAATAAALLLLRPAPRPGPVRRFRVPVEGLTTRFYPRVVLTRDGRSLAWEANDRIWIRRMDQLDALEVPGSRSGVAPFWSWDERTLAFAANKKLWAFTLGAEQSRAICDIPESGEIMGGAWGSEARIVLALWRGGLCEVPASGGDVRPLLAPDSATVDFHNPGYLPDGRTLLLYVHDKAGKNSVAILAGEPPRLRRVLEDPKAAAVGYAYTGHLLVTREEGANHNSIWAVPFPAARRTVTGPAFRVLDGASLPAGASDGLLAALEDEPPSRGQLVWKPRDGDGVVTIGESQEGLLMPALSPDGDRVAFLAVKDGNPDLWVLDLARGTRTRLTSSAAADGYPAWSPDGTLVYYGSNEGVGTERILAVASDGSGSPDTIARGWQPAASPDGKSLIYTVDRRGSGDLWTVRLDQGREARPFLETPSRERTPAFSPDGRWVAYTSDESGRTEIYVRRYPEGDARAQVSVGGGRWPRWTRRGDGIYYVKGDTLRMVSVEPGPRLVLGMPRALFSASAGDIQLDTGVSDGFPVDLSVDGTRFIGVRRTAPPTTRSLLFVENWFEEFRQP